MCIDNHDDESLVNFARSKWEMIVKNEQNISVNETIEQSFIEISEYGEGSTYTIVVHVIFSVE